MQQVYNRKARIKIEFSRHYSKWQLKVDKLTVRESMRRVVMWRRVKMMMARGTWGGEHWRRRDGPDFRDRDRRLWQLRQHQWLLAVPAASLRAFTIVAHWKFIKTYLIFVSTIVNSTKPNSINLISNELLLFEIRNPTTMASCFSK